MLTMIHLILSKRVDGESQPNMLSHLSSVQRPEDGYLVREMNLTLLTPII